MNGKKGNGLFVLLVLAIGIIAGSLAIRQSLENRGHAANYNNINSAADITKTNNVDGTMGPTTWEGNFSNSLPSNMLGVLDVHVTDPTQGKRPIDIPTQPQHPSITPGQNPNSQQPNSVSVSSLLITLRKVEVHMDYLGTPGKSMISQTPVPTGSPTPTRMPKSTPTPRQQLNGPTDHWEVIEMPVPVTLDLVALAKTHNFASLGLTRLGQGQYSELRMYIDSATATLTDGTKVTPIIPGHANIVRIVERFTILAGTTILSIDFDAQNSVIKTGSLYLFNPVVAHFDQTNQQ